MNNNASLRGTGYLLALLICLIAFPVRSATFVFDTPANYDLAATANRILSADLNNDGKIDLLTITQVSSTNFLKILTNTGNGTFVLATNFNLGTSITYLACTGYFDQNTNVDIALLTSGGTSMVMMLGDGNCGFTNLAPLALSGGYNVATSGDFNNDGKTDIAIDQGAARVLTSNGDGTFSIGSSFSSGTHYGVVAADFNGDGKLDLATSNYSTNGLTITMGLGNGTFGTGVTYRIGTDASDYHYGIVAADFNGDGKPDIATTSFYSHTINVLLNKGNGTFGPATDYTASGSIMAIEAADMNGDGKLDLVVSGDNPVILPGYGDGTFAPAYTYPVFSGASISRFTTADFDHDGKVDFAYSGPVAKSITFLRNLTPTNIPPTVTIISPTNNAVLFSSTTPTFNTLAHDTGWNVYEVRFFDGANYLGRDIDRVSTFSLSTTNVGPGAHTITAVAYDVDGGTATNSISIVINRRPTVALTNPLPNSVFLTSNTIALKATASDPDGSVKSVDFFYRILPVDQTLIVTLTNAPYEWTLTNVPPGRHYLFARVTDNNGEVQATSDVTVSVLTNADCSSAVISSNTVSFDVQTIKPMNYAIEVSTNLSATNGWTTLTNFTALSNSYHFMESLKTNSSGTFYRVRTIK